MNKLARQLNNSVSPSTRTLVTQVVEFSLFGGIVTALVIGVIRLQ